jgi:SAM-dependent methyltransferase
VPGLADGTLDDPVATARIRAVVQAISDLVGARELERMRGLDLGAGAGAISAELALRGAQMVAIEGRESNSAAIRALAAEAGVGDRVEVMTADVRRLDWGSLGSFDVVACSGLLYHLELDDVVDLIAAVRGACSRLVVIDTEVAWAPVERRLSRGRPYAGHAFREHAPGSTPSQRAAARKASLDNEEAFWLTRTSLHALLHDAGFSSSLELGAPGQPLRERRVTVVGLAGDQVRGLALGEPRGGLDPRPAEPPTGRVLRAHLLTRRAGAAVSRLRKRLTGSARAR